MNLKIEFLANAAILLEYSGLRVLVDGIYDYCGNEFSNLSREQWENICDGQDENSKIEYLIFTHVHSDHFSAEKLIEYLKLYSPKGIILPDDAIAANPLLERSIKEKSIPCLLLSKSTSSSVNVNLDDNVIVKAFHMEHLDVGEKNLQHFCILIQIEKRKLLFTGDVNFSAESFDLLKGEQLDAVFVNPLFYLSNEGKRHFNNGNLHTKKQIIYHIPFKENDVMGIRRIMENENAKQMEEKVFLLERGQIVYL